MLGVLDHPQQRDCPDRVLPVARGGSSGLGEQPSPFVVAKRCLLTPAAVAASPERREPGAVTRR